jgi:hypothetical protein
MPCPSPCAGFRRLKARFLPCLKLQHLKVSVNWELVHFDNNYIRFAASCSLPA